MHFLAGLVSKVAASLAAGIDILARAMREGSLPREEIAELREAFEAHQVGGTRTEEAAGLPKEVLWKLLSTPEYLGSAGLAEEFLSYADERAGLLVGLGGGSQANTGQSSVMEDLLESA